MIDVQVMTPKNLANVSNVGPAYVKELEDLDLTPTMKLYAKFHELMSNKRMVAVYPEMANEMMKVMFAVDGKLPERMDKAMLKVLKNSHM